MHDWRGSQGLYQSVTSPSPQRNVRVTGLRLLSVIGMGVASIWGLFSGQVSSAGLVFWTMLVLHGCYEVSITDSTDNYIRKYFSIFLGHVYSVLLRHWTVVGGLGIKNAIFIVQPCFYIQGTQFSMVFFQLLWWVTYQSAGCSRPAPPIVGRTLVYNLWLLVGAPLIVHVMQLLPDHLTFTTRPFLIELKTKIDQCLPFEHHI